MSSLSFLWDLYPRFPFDSSPILRMKSEEEPKVELKRRKISSFSFLILFSFSFSGFRFQTISFIQFEAAWRERHTTEITMKLNTKIKIFDIRKRLFSIALQRQCCKKFDKWYGFQSDLLACSAFHLSLQFLNVICEKRIKNLYLNNFFKIYYHSQQTLKIKTL